MTAQTILPANSVTESYEVSNSLRFNTGSDHSLTKTFSSAGNRAVWTWSAWMKVGGDAGFNGLFTVGQWDGGSTATGVILYANTFNTYWNAPNGGTSTSAKYRDPSAWYHVVLQANTSTLKLYVNGEQQTSRSISGDGQINIGSAEHAIGRYSGAGSTFNGYMSEIVFIDGTALAPTSFGEFDSISGIWKPIDVSGLTFGSNGFYLEFKQAGTSQNSSGLGADTSGNDNHWAVNNLTATSQSTDTCTNNFATLNPLNIPAANGPTFINGNLKTTCAVTGAAYMGSATIGVASGKWYAEMKVKTIDSIIAGVSANVAEDARDSTYPGAQGDSAGILLGSGNKYINDSGTTHGDAFSENDILMIALDLDNNNVYFGRNGNWFDGSGNADESNPTSAIALTAAASTQDGFYFFSVADGGGSAAASASWNFGSPAYAISSSNADANGHGNFEYAVPSGYFALNTKNLAEHG